MCLYTYISIYLPIYIYIYTYISNNLYAHQHMSDGEWQVVCGVEVDLFLSIYLSLSKYLGNQLCLYLHIYTYLYLYIDTTHQHMSDGEWQVERGVEVDPDACDQSLSLSISIYLSIHLTNYVCIYLHIYIYMRTSTCPMVNGRCSVASRSIQTPAISACVHMCQPYWPVSGSSSSAGLTAPEAST